MRKTGEFIETKDSLGEYRYFLPEELLPDPDIKDTSSVHTFY